MNIPVSQVEAYISKRVHFLYWEKDINCARTALTVLSELFEQNIFRQTLDSAIGLHGAGGFRAQCGLVEGSMMFISIYSREQFNKNDREISDLCFDFAKSFESVFSSLSCYYLRPGGFSKDDPPHLCEGLSNRGIFFAYNYVVNKIAGTHHAF